jgi:hypothetical protein
MSRFRGVLVAAAVAATTLIFVPAVMAAGTYTVLSCSDPTGALNAAAGWAMTPPATGSGLAANTCLAGGTLNATIAGPTPGGDASASWQFAAPPNTRIVRLAAARTTTGVVKGTTPNDVEYVLATDSGTLESCLVSDTSSCVGDLTATIDKQGLNASSVGFRVLCTNVGSVCLRPLRTDFKGLAVGLADPSPPAVSNIQVLDSGDTSGVLSLTFNADDAGGGVYRALVKVDGALFRAQSLAPAPCVDAVPLDADPYQFIQPIPCPLSVAGAAVQVDYRDLGPGPHAVEIDVEDAAGNSTAVFGPIAFPKLNVEVQSNNVQSVQNVLKGHLRMWFVKNHGRTFTSKYGTRVVTRGILSDSAGHGIQGARVDVYHILHGGKKRLLKTGLKSRAQGHLTLILPLNVDTRHIEYDYRALRPGPITSSASLKLNVMLHGHKFFRAAK